MTVSLLSHWKGCHARKQGKWEPRGFVSRALEKRPCQDGAMGTDWLQVQPRNDSLSLFLRGDSDKVDLSLNRFLKSPAQFMVHRVRGIQVVRLQVTVHSECLLTF